MVEVVQVERFKSLDGRVYDTEAQAEQADRFWRDENEYDVEKEIARLNKRCKRDRKTTEHQEMQRAYKGTSTFPRVVIYKGKHDDEYFVARNFDGMIQGIWEWFRFQCDPDYGFYKYLPKSKEISQRILELGDKEAAYAFVMERSEERCEYECLDWYPVKEY